ncbi:unnamed protein product [Psylliodes chrysocephalus]|uniref:Uncharacterized protein n=1 Tax=Psylliodes chrysocephalus TaxID=3402493 RepID=A0A9P0GGB6_9CUCU|nr:unnamed protein product [Psylliodes chrysocephala]
MHTVLEEMKKTFEMTVSEAGYYVGLNIVRNKDGSIFIHQSNYIRKIIKRFNLETANPVAIPADPNANLTICDDDSFPLEEVPYREAVGSLMFTAVVSRPDIMYAVGVVSRYVTNYSTIHWNAVKRIIRYLKSTIYYGIKYECNSNLPILFGYSDSDYAGDADTRLSTTGYLFKIGNGPVSWCSKRQRSVSLSTTEAEYVAASEATKEAIWIQQLLNDIGEKEVSNIPIKLFIDNQSAIRLIRNPEFYKRTKHVDIRYHFIRQKYEDGQINPDYVHTNNQIADILTKPLAKEKFRRFLIMMNLMSIQETGQKERN